MTEESPKEPSMAEKLTAQINQLEAQKRAALEECQGKINQADGAIKTCVWMLNELAKAAKMDEERAAAARVDLVKKYAKQLFDLPESERTRAYYAMLMDDDMRHAVDKEMRDLIAADIEAKKAKMPLLTPKNIRKGDYEAWAGDGVIPPARSRKKEKSASKH